MADNEITTHTIPVAGCEEPLILTGRLLGPQSVLSYRQASHRRWELHSLVIDAYEVEVRGPDRTLRPVRVIPINLCGLATIMPVRTHEWESVLLAKGWNVAEPYRDAMRQELGLKI